jgi:hypothetical protein
MTYPSYRAALDSLLEFSAADVRNAHCIVLLANGRFYRVLGAPGPGTRHVRGRLWACQ